MRTLYLAGLALTAVLAQPALAATAKIPPENPIQTEVERKASAARAQSPRDIINAFNQLAFFDRKPIEAFEKYLSPDFVERYPDLIDPACQKTDKECSIDFFRNRGWKPGEGMTDIIYQVIEEGDRVVVFHKVTRGPDDRGMGFVDIFRVKDGLIMEHWAVGQPIAETVSARHSMF